jgi:hypothetical protein
MKKFLLPIVALLATTGALSAGTHISVGVGPVVRPPVMMVYQQPCCPMPAPMMVAPPMMVVPAPFFSWSYVRPHHGHHHHWHRSHHGCHHCHR